jgi:hypothetical protein
LIGYFPLTGRHGFRMREQAGTTYLDTLTDAGTWSQLGDAATPFSADFMDVTVSVGVGTYNVEATASTVVWDNLNVP